MKQNGQLSYTKILRECVEEVTAIFNVKKG